MKIVSAVEMALKSLLPTFLHLQAKFPIFTNCLIILWRFGRVRGQTVGFTNRTHHVLESALPLLPLPLPPLEHLNMEKVAGQMY